MTGSRQELILAAVNELQSRLELILYEADPLGIAGGPLDEYAFLGTELVSALTRSRGTEIKAVIQHKIPETTEELTARITEAWLEHPILHEINVPD